jgi:hypothetical protein
VLYFCQQESKAEDKFMTDRTLPKPGEFYRHFKNRLYQIICVAKNSETEEPVVVYQALYGDFGIWARPAEEFLSEVDHEKYPQIRQKYRFEPVVPKKAEPRQNGTEDMAQGITVTNGTGRPSALSPEDNAGTEDDAAEAEEGVKNSVLIEFLDADDKEVKKAVLTRNIKRITQSDLDGIYTSYGITGFGGSEKQQVEGLLKFLEMQEQYEGDHLRGGKTSCSTSRKN